MNRQSEPPVFLERLVESLCDRGDVDLVLGDLSELYHQRMQQTGRAYANVRYVTDFIGLLIYGAFRKRKRTRYNPMFMISNYITIAFRQLVKQKMHYLINITGLGIGLAVSLIIGIFVWNEFSFDRFHANGDRTYLVPMTWKIGGTATPVAEATSGAGPFIKEHFPAVESMVRIRAEQLVFTSGGHTFEEQNVSAVDSAFFDIFSFHLLEGNQKTALTNPLSLVLTERTAIKYFGEGWRDRDILAQSLEGQNKKLYQITGVVQDPPPNSHIQFDMLLSMSSLPGHKTPNWDSSSYFTYVLLVPGVSPGSIVSEIPKMLSKYVGGWAEEHIDMDLVPFHDLYLRSRAYPGIPGASDIRYVYIFGVIAILVLVIALVNYMNLSTARSLERAREVGVRRVAGAVRFELFTQFMCESFAITLLSMLVAIAVTKIGIPFFNTLSGKELDFNILFSVRSALYLILLLFLVTVLGGFYPALVLSGFRPAAVLKGNFIPPSGINLRRVLVIGQFAVSSGLIVSALMIRAQLQFMSNAKLGFDRDQIIALSLDSVSRGRLPVLKKEFSRTANVEAAVPVIQLPVNVTMRSALSFDNRERQLVSVLGTSNDFLAATGVELVAGRNFSESAEERKTWEFFVNEAALRLFDMTRENVLGKEIVMWGRKGIVVGVVKNFHYAPLHKPIEPLVVSTGQENAGSFNYLLLRINGGDYAGIMESVESKWKQLAPESPFNFNFLNDRYNRLYLTEARLNKIMDTFSALAVIIACLGLFGLSSYTIIRRTKELGIRKVMGASPVRLVATVSAGFVWVVMIAFMIAIPICWMAMNAWLKNFHYHITFSWSIVIITGMSTVAITIIVVCYHATAAALANPVKSLRTE